MLQHLHEEEKSVQPMREPAKMKDLYKEGSAVGSSSHYLPEVLSTFRASMPSIEE
jgi:hypothetical protein